MGIKSGRRMNNIFFENLFNKPSPPAVGMGQIDNDKIPDSNMSPERNEISIYLQQMASSGRIKNIWIGNGYWGAFTQDWQFDSSYWNSAEHNYWFIEYDQYLGDTEQQLLDLFNRGNVQDYEILARTPNDDGKRMSWRLPINDNKILVVKW